MSHSHIVSYKKLYYEKYDEIPKNKNELMDQNCKYALKIANKLEKEGKLTEAINFYKEAIKFGGNYDVIILDIGYCESKLNYKSSEFSNIYGF